MYKARSRLPIGLVQSLANTGLSDLKNFLRKCKAIHLKKKKKTTTTDKMSCRLSSNYHGFLTGKTSTTREKDAQKAKGKHLGKTCIV